MRNRVGHRLGHVLLCVGSCAGSSRWIDALGRDAELKDSSGGYGAEPPSLGPSRGRSGTSYGLTLDPRCVLGVRVSGSMWSPGRRQHGELPLPDGTEPLVGMTGESRTRPEKSFVPATT